MNFKRIIKSSFYLLTCLALVLSLTACNKRKSEAKEMVNSFVEAYRSLDFDTMYNMTHDQMAYLETLYIPDEPNNKTLFEALSSNLEFKITKVTISDDGTVNVYAHTKNIDAAALMEKTIGGFVNKLESGEESDTDKAYADSLAAALSSSDLAYTEKDTVFNLVTLDDGSLAIESNVGIYDDLCGGYLQFFFDTNYAGGIKQALGDMQNGATDETTTTDSTN
jgi:hypothetical protein